MTSVSGNGSVAGAVRHSLLAARSFLLPLVVFAAAAWALLGQVTRVGYNTDEGQHIATAGYFDVVFLHGQLSGPPWEEIYWTLTQPTIPRFILGAAIRLSGSPVPPLDLEHRIDEAHGPNRERYLDPSYYRDERRLAEARRIDRPSAAVLQAGRTPMALFGAGAALLLFLIGRTLSGPVGGLVAAAGLLATPLAFQLLPRAHAEGPLIFFTLLGLYLAILASRAAAGPDPSRYLLLGALAGIVTGLAAATKLTALLGTAALGGLAIWAFSLRRLAAGTPGARAVSDRTWRWAALAAILSLVVFVGVNPFLWPNPVQRTLAMLQFRQQEVVGQRALNEDLAVPDHLPTRVGLLLSETFVQQMPISRWTDVPLEAALVLIGAGALAWGALRSRDGGGLVGPAALTLAWVVVFLAGTAPNLGIDWARYYLPTLSLGLILVGVGADVLVGASGRAWRRWRQRRPAQERATAAASS
ncbi:MAG: glycosyltransferase family 39 protein [Chloroflexota bacterium]|nr:glycosyltransferase family 39 protein [Chloroflexota bacterium]